MWYSLNELQDKIKIRRQQKFCKRCGLLYKKIMDNCPHCHHIKDYKLKLLLKKRAKERISLGKGMVLGALVIMFIMTTR